MKVQVKISKGLYREILAYYYRKLETATSRLNSYEDSLKAHENATTPHDKYIMMNLEEGIIKHQKARAAALKAIEELENTEIVED